MNKSVFGIVCLLLLGGTVMFATSHQLASADRSRNLVTHTYIVIDHLRQLESAIGAAESSMSGFVITGKNDYLTQYKKLMGELGVVKTEIAELRNLTTDNASQQRNLENLQPVLNGKLQNMATAIALVRMGSLIAAQEYISIGQGKQLMDRIHSITTEMVAIEQALLNERTAEEIRSNRINAIMAVGLAVMLAMAVLLALLAIQRELGRRKKAEISLREISAFQRTILDSSLHTIIATDEQGIIRLFNPAAERLFGYKADELVGRHTPHILHDASDSLKRANELSQELGREVKPGFDVYVAKASREGGEEREWVYRHKEGMPLPVLSSITPIHNEAGRITGYLGISQDISKRKRAEEELRRSEAFNRSLMNASVDCVKILDLDGRLLQMNQPGLCVMEIDDFGTICGKEWWDLWPEETRIQVEKSVREAAAGRQYRFQAFCPTAKSAPKWWDVQVSPVLDSKGHVIHILSVSRDITDAKQIERMKNEFISTVSHELRTPLTSISSSLGLLSTKIAGDMSQKASYLIEVARKNCDRLTRLINDILDIEKIEAGAIVFTPKLLSVDALLRQAVEENQGFAEKFGITLAAKGEAADALITADPDRLSQIFTNLLSNAVKFSPPNAVVRLTWQRVGESVRISVTDNGPGIPTEFQGRIFAKFAQADSSSSRSKGGTGLGLSITKAMIENMGGEIRFESEPGRTVFHILLPETRSSAALPAAPAAPSERRILICENDPNIAALLELWLNKEGFASTVAPTAALAKQRLKEGHYNAMTLDLALPDQDGLSLIHQLREEDSTIDLPIIVISGHVEEGRKRLGGEAFGIVDWITKPIDAAKLTQALRSINTAAPAEILYVEDDSDLVELYGLSLQHIAHITHASTLADARFHLSSRRFDLAILDIALPDGNGLDLLGDLNNRPHPIPVVILSATQYPHEMKSQVAASMVKAVMPEEKILQTISSLLYKRHQHAA